MDSDVYAIGTGTGRILVGYESNLTVVNPSTVVTGIGLLGSSLVQPAYAQGFVVGSLSVEHPTLTKWTKSFVSISGISQEALYVGALETSGANIPSQPVTFTYRDNADVYQAYTLQVNALGSLCVNSTGTGGSLAVGGLLYSYDLLVRPAMPASTDSGMPGQIKTGGGYLYVCVASGDWRRIALEAGY